MCVYEFDSCFNRFIVGKYWGWRNGRNATRLNSRYKNCGTRKIKIISVKFRRVRGTKHKKDSKIGRNEIMQVWGCKSWRFFLRQKRATNISFSVFTDIVLSTSLTIITTMKNINQTVISRRDDIIRIHYSSANLRIANTMIQPILRTNMNLKNNLTRQNINLII